MSGMLDNGARLTIDDGHEAVVTGMLGAGGQGEVYRVSTDQGEKALKWYYPACATAEQRKIVEELVGRDFDDDRFLWPQSFVTGRGDGFGYLMDVRPDRFKGLPALFRRRLRTTPQALVTAGLHMVEAYQALHSRGIAYRDISWGNIFFDPATGDVLVCDNDNAVVEGEASGISGTMEFMAPELVRGDSGAIPGTQTDLHSLSVLLFMLLMNHHPLKGKAELAIRCLDEAAERKLYGKSPLFIFDPDDHRNAPDPTEQGTVLATWAAAPPALRKLFIQNFTEGLRDASRRVRESQWRDALSEVRDTIVVCASCGRQNMTEPRSATARACWSCGRTLLLPPRLVITTPPPRTERHVRLGHAARLHAHHVRAEPPRHDYTDATLVAELTEHPKKPGKFGLANRSDAAWTARRTDGTSQTVAPGQTLPLRSGLTVNLAGAEAVVRGD
ncbi:Serine/threonine-protein kinase StkP [Streptomyces netropsis]|uniref:DNA-binding helix-hairpin-helix protein with protein kinase domain n=1 Tax=Streptomyces syringium TaxID=76729 RepID=A0ABS4YB97_9ACTN|nr:protein kinase [Streptomyces syringium]MBP2406067.1 DNA-binding helix-hairpin-helix protein with protein kinase domain [Streptomyces syringium]SPE64032.1 Serine/threonine-protein kinase StkP [Streptomyces netropsis]